jgi:prephenate dehydrogenase
MQQISIIGLGLIGGSLGMALKSAGMSEIEIVGHDENWRTLSRAEKLQAIDRGERELHVAVRGADLIIIATPILAVKQVLQDISQQLKADCVVTDTGSTKSQVAAWADEYLPSSVDFVGGHPMAGKEYSGIEEADPDLFVDATYCLIPSIKTSGRAVEIVSGLVEKVGAIPYYPSAEEHDALAAAVSHVPLVMSAALISATSESASWRELYTMASSGFRDVTRLASSDPIMATDICMTNGEAIGHWIDRIIQELEQYKKMIGDGSTELQDNLISTQTVRDRWVNGEDVWPQKAGPEVPGFKDQMTAMFLGEALAKRTKQILDVQRHRMNNMRMPKFDPEQDGDKKK